MAQENTNNMVDAMESFSTTVTSYAEATNSTWPFVTIPNYPSRAERLRKLAKANTVAFLPLVDEMDRDA